MGDNDFQVQRTFFGGSIPGMQVNASNGAIVNGVSPFTDACKYQITVKIPPPENQGEAIKRARKLAGWTGEDLAEWLGVNKATVYHWENGGQILRKKDKEKVGLFLG